MMRRFTGLYAGSFWLIVVAALLPIHLLWFRARRSALMLFLLGILMMAGMWGDHFMTLVTTQHHDFLPSSQAFYTTSFWAVTTWLGTVGLFGSLMLLVLRYVPVASIVESRLLAREQESGAACLSEAKLYGVAAEFAAQDALLAAVVRPRCVGSACWT